MNRKRIALVAHDNKKKDLIEWAEWNWHVLTACNRATADYLISSSLLNQEYTPQQSDFTSYTGRKVSRM